MKRRKILTGLLSLTILSLSATSAFALDAVGQGVTNTNEVMPINSTIEAEAGINMESPFGSFTGKVVDITDRVGTDSKMISLADENELPANIIIDKDTYILNKDALEKGATVTAYYQSNIPMILIYPPQYKALVLSVDSEDNIETVKVDFFDRNLVSADNNLKISISEETKVVTQNGDPYTGDLAWKNLVVIYTVSTKSIPAQTTPSEVIVLSKESSPVIDYAYVEVKVDGKVLDKVHPYGDKDTIMVPVRPVAEALGYDVKWDSATKEVRLGNGISLTIGKDYYVYMKTAPISLGVMPTLVDGTTYVPLSFFSEVARASNVEVTLRQVIIDK